MREFIVVALLAAVSTQTSASAQELYEKKIAQWGDPLTPPHTRSRCVKEASTNGFKCSGLRCSHTVWKTCVGWAVDTQTMQCELFMRVPRLAGLTADAQAAARNVAEGCAVWALASAGAASLESAGAALAALKPAFLACVQSKGGQALAALSISVDQKCGWSKWSNE